MGDSTCLLRSFSTPADTSSVPQEFLDFSPVSPHVALVDDRNQRTWEPMSLGNPMRVLGESISFGRFLSENLDWEKWSAFSHNRYVEEAEKYSKPGSVAAKKAYFEAHYKRKAVERAATLMQEANAQTSGTFDSETQEANCADSSVTVGSKADGIVTANEQPVKDAVDYQVVDCADTNKCGAGQSDSDISNVEGAVGQSDLGISNVDGAGDVPHPSSDTNLNVGSCNIADSSSQFDNVEVHRNIAVPGEERVPDPMLQGAADQEVLPLPVKGTEVNSSPKLSTKTRAAKLSHSLNERKAATALPPRSGINKKSVRVSTENRRLTARSLHMSINLPSGTGETSKTAAAAAQSRNGINSVPKSRKAVEGSVEKKRLSARSLYMSVNLPSGAGETSTTATAAVKPRNVINSTSNSMKSGGDPVEKRPTARSLRMSINLPCGTGETSKMASVFDNRTKKNHSNLPNISKDHPVASRISTKASHDFSNQPSENPLSQGRRTEGLLNKSVSGGVTANAKLSSIPADSLKSSSTTKSIPRPPTISSPFRFRSDERAVKRKEFLQRMDEIKNKEAEKLQLQRTPKDNIEHDFKKLRQSIVSKPKLNEDRHGGSHSPSHQIRKTSLTQPRSPNLGRKASPKTVQDKHFGNSWKPPISTNNSKRITEKINQTTRHSVTSLSNVTRENASPNIQH